MGLDTVHAAEKCEDAQIQSAASDIEAAAATVPGTSVLLQHL